MTEDGLVLNTSYAAAILRHSSCLLIPALGLSALQPFMSEALLSPMEHLGILIVKTETWAETSQQELLAAHEATHHSSISIIKVCNAETSRSCQANH